MVYCMLFSSRNYCHIDLGRHGACKPKTYKDLFVHKILVVLRKHTVEVLLLGDSAWQDFSEGHHCEHIVVTHAVQPGTHIIHLLL
jgi:hypothetical protein